MVYPLYGCTITHDGTQKPGVCLHVVKFHSFRELRVDRIILGAYALILSRF